MEFKDFLFWRRQPNPRDILKADLEEFVELEKVEAFQKYRSIIEWRIHNVAEQLLRKPKEQRYFEGFVDGLRVILQDFRRVRELAEKRKKENHGRK